MIEQKIFIYLLNYKNIEILYFKIIINKIIIYKFFLLDILEINEIIKYNL